MSFICAFCSNTYTSERGLNIHLNKIHNIERKEFTCKYCNKSFNRPSKQTNHEAECTQNPDVKPKVKVEEQKTATTTVNGNHNNVSTSINTVNNNTNNNTYNIATNINILVVDEDVKHVIETLVPVTKNLLVEYASDIVHKDMPASSEKELVKSLQALGLRRCLFTTDGSKRSTQYIDGDENKLVKDHGGEQLSTKAISAMKNVFLQAVKDLDEKINEIEETHKEIIAQDVYDTTSINKYIGLRQKQSCLNLIAHGEENTKKKFGKILCNASPYFKSKLATITSNDIDKFSSLISFLYDIIKRNFGWFKTYSPYYIGINTRKNLGKVINIDQEGKLLLINNKGKYVEADQDFLLRLFHQSTERAVGLPYTNIIRCTKHILPNIDCISTIPRMYISSSYVVEDCVYQASELLYKKFQTIADNEDFIGTIFNPEHVFCNEFFQGFMREELQIDTTTDPVMPL